MSKLDRLRGVLRDSSLPLLLFCLMTLLGKAGELVSEFVGGSSGTGYWIGGIVGFLAAPLVLVVTAPYPREAPPTANNLARDVKEKDAP